MTAGAKLTSHSTVFMSGSGTVYILPSIVYYVHAFLDAGLTSRGARYQSPTNLSYIYFRSHFSEMEMLIFASHVSK